MRGTQRLIGIAMCLGFLAWMPTLIPGLLAAPVNAPPEAPKPPSQNSLPQLPDGIYRPQEYFFQMQAGPIACSTRQEDDWGKCWQKGEMPLSFGQTRLLIRSVGDVHQYVHAVADSTEFVRLPPISHSDWSIVLDVTQAGPRKGIKAPKLKMCHFLEAWYQGKLPLDLVGPDANGMYKKTTFDRVGDLSSIKNADSAFGTKQRPCGNPASSERQPVTLGLAAVVWRTPVIGLAPAQLRPSWFADGELLIRLEDNFKAADRDAWFCLVRDGNYPNIQFTEGGRTEEIFVGPDARFQTEIRGGATYGVRLGTTRCDHQTLNVSSASLRVPLTHGVTPEKIVISCFLHEGHLGQCKAMYLVRPG